MTTPKMTPVQDDRSRALVRAIGAAFREARRARSDRQEDIACAIGLGNYGDVSIFERGLRPNLQVSTAVRYLALYGLTLTVTKIERNSQ